MTSTSSIAVGDRVHPDGQPWNLGTAKSFGSLSLTGAGRPRVTVEVQHDYSRVTQWYYAADLALADTTAPAETGLCRDCGHAAVLLAAYGGRCSDCHRAETDRLARQHVVARGEAMVALSLAMGGGDPDDSEATYTDAVTDVLVAAAAAGHDTGDLIQRAEFHLLDEVEA